MTRTTLGFAFLFLVNIIHAWDCKQVQVGNEKWDLTSFAKENAVEREQKFFEAILSNIYTFNPCSPIARTEKPVEEQCKETTLVCKSVWSKKVNSTAPPLCLGTFEAAGGTVDANPTPTLDADGNLTVAMTGGESLGSDGKKVSYSTTFQFKCTKDSLPFEVVEDIDGQKSNIRITLFGPGACSTKSDNPAPSPPPAPSPAPEQPRKGRNFFASLLLVFFWLVVIYFMGGCLYRFFALGERGINILPNADFWIDWVANVRDLFGMIRDRLTGRSNYNLMV
jgi:hypothetical protein